MIVLKFFLGWESILDLIRDLYEEEDASPFVVPGSTRLEMRQLKEQMTRIALINL